MNKVPFEFERRAEPRRRIEHLELEIDGERLTILDISIEAVRFEKPVRASLDRAQIPFAFVGIGDAERFSTVGVLVREGQSSAVLAYTAPSLDWEARLAAYANLAFGTGRLPAYA